MSDERVMPSYDGTWLGSLLGEAAARTHPVCVVLVDGLGEAQLAARGGHAPFLSRQSRQTMTVGFPSTTVASIGSFGTGLPPGKTALAGYALRDPATGRRTVLIQWDTTTPPDVWQPHETVAEQLARAGSPLRVIAPPKFDGSLMTRSNMRGGVLTTVTTAAAWVDAVNAAMRAPGAAVAYAYWGQLDKVGHVHGWQSGQWAAAIEELDGAVADVARALPRGAELWLTADHGMVDVEGAERWDVARVPELAGGVDMVAGEPRALHVYVDSAVPAAHVAMAWESVLGESAWVWTRDDAIRIGLFGDVEPRVEPYLGDVIVAMRGAATVVDSRFQPSNALALIGHHGSLTSAEMCVPLIRWE